jgi:hypothetical protein
MSKLTLIFVAALALASPAAHAWDLVELGDLIVEHKQFAYASSPFLPDQHPTTETNLKLNMVFFESGYIRNTIHTQTDASQYRLVGWNWEFGFRLTDYFEVGWWHFSRHQLDAQDPNFRGGWKEDGIIFRIFLLKGAQPGGIF